MQLLHSSIRVDLPRLVCKWNGVHGVSATWPFIDIYCLARHEIMNSWDEPQHPGSFSLFKHLGGTVQMGGFLLGKPLHGASGFNMLGIGKHMQNECNSTMINPCNVNV